MRREKPGFSRDFGEIWCQNVVFWWSSCGAMCGGYGVLNGVFWRAENGTGFLDLFLK
jgi:hypothetical protein